MSERARTTLLIISDLHAGGERGPGGAPGIWICTAVSEGQHGDLVDFLAEKEFSPSTMTHVFVQDIRSGRLDPYREHVPTSAPTGVSGHWRGGAAPAGEWPAVRIIDPAALR